MEIPLDLGPPADLFLIGNTFRLWKGTDSQLPSHRLWVVRKYILVRMSVINQSINHSFIHLVIRIKNH